MTAGPFLSSSWHRVASLRPRIRSHVQVHRHRYRGRAWYVVKDEVSGRSHRFTPAVYTLIGGMDGRKTVDALWKDLVERLGDDAPAQDDVIQILSQLHSADLLQSDMPPDALELFERRESAGRSKLLQRFANPMSLKFPLWDPDRFLMATLPQVRPLFGWFGLILWTTVVGSALVIAAVHWPELSQNVTDRVFATENLLAIALVFPFVKAIHELGHGWATRVNGGPVHEFGVMLLVLAPVPYVDASAASAFRDKWSRALVGAAGMIFEVFVAALALFVWVLSEPGTVRSVAYDVMLIAGVSTLVFNGNPLLRFDAYYILSDVIETPNLGARATRWWAWWAQHRLFGAPVEPPQSTPGERVWFVLYGPASYVYRLTVMFGVAMLVATQFFVVGVMIAIWSVTMGLVWPVAKALGFVLSSPRLRENRLRANLVTFGAIAVIALGLFVVPIPLHTDSEGVVWLPDESFVRMGTDGFVEKLLVEPGSIVQRGDPLIVAADPALEADARVAEAQVAAVGARLEAESVDDRVQADLTRQELSVRSTGLERSRERLRQLTVMADTDGTFVVARAADLPGRHLKRGEVIGYVMGDLASTVRVVASQANVDLVRDRTTGVRVMFPDTIGRTLPAYLLREVPGGSDRLPSKALADGGGGPFAADPRDPSGVKTLQRTFQFDLVLFGARQGWFGSRVHVRFEHGAEPLGWQAWRRLRQLFLARFDA